jgi:hypothetical protein
MQQLHKAATGEVLMLIFYRNRHQNITHVYIILFFRFVDSLLQVMKNSFYFCNETSAQISAIFKFHQLSGYHKKEQMDCHSQHEFEILLGPF